MRPITLLTAIVGAALLLSACEKSSAPEPTATTPSRADQESSAPAADESTLVAALGDSITAGSPLWDPSPQIREQLGAAADPASQFEFWATESDPSLEFRNCGVFGERTDEIAARLDSCAEGADALVIQGGINNIAQGAPLEGAREDLHEMVVTAKDLGLDVAITDVLPWNNGYPAADPEIRRLNRMIAAIAEEEEVPLLPFYDTLEDPENPGRMAIDLTDDGDHPSVAGYRLLGTDAVLPALAPSAG